MWPTLTLGNMKNLLVVGGTGFLGKHICTAALNAGWKVTSLSRSGRLKNIDGLPVSVLSQIKWEKADVFDTSSYQELLERSDAVVHTMGTIFASPDYKSSMDKPLSICNVASTAVKSLYGSNPMESRSSSSSETTDQFDLLNKQSAVKLATAFAKCHNCEPSVDADNAVTPATHNTPQHSPFIYISADDWNPLVDRRYISSKYSAESVLSMIPNLRSVFLRPGFMYNEGESSPSAASPGESGVSLRQIVRLGDRAMGMLGFPRKSISVQAVAQAAVEALDDPSIEGVVSLEALQKFASMTNRQPSSI